MRRFVAELVVWPRPGSRDPAAEAVERVLQPAAKTRVAVAAVGKVMRLEVEAADEGTARATVEDLCARLLVNPTLERHEIRLEPCVPPPR